MTSFVMPTSAVNAETHLFGVFGEVNPLSLEHHKARIMAVMLLLFLCGPAAIFGAVWAVVVNSFYGFSVLSRPHVRCEIINTFSPSFADRNSSTSVSTVTDAFGVIAPLHHSTPDRVKRVSGWLCLGAWSVPLSSDRLQFFSVLHPVNVKAPTTPGGSIAKELGGYFRGISAVALTNPSGALASSFPNES